MRVALTPPALKRDRFCTVVSVTDTGDGDLVSFEGIDDLTAAEGITGCYVLANRDDFELDSLDAAYADLMGREVVDERFGSKAGLAGAAQDRCGHDGLKHLGKDRKGLDQHVVLPTCPYRSGRP